MIAVGADAQSVSMLALLVNLILSFICIKAPDFIERLGLTKRGALILALINTCVWVPLILSFIMLNDTVSPFWFIIVWLINLVPGVLLSAHRDNWLSSIIPKGTMGRYLGRRMAIKSVFYLVSFCLMGYLLDSADNGVSAGLFTVFFIAFFAAFVNFGIYWFMNDAVAKTVDIKEQKQSGFSVFDFFAELNKRRLTSFIVFTSLFSITVSLCGPLYSVYMLKELNFSYLGFTLIIATEYFARIISVPFWGKFADKSGNIQVLNIVSRVIPFIPVCWLFFSSIGYFTFIQFVSGICWGAYDLCTQNYLFKLAPPEKKLRYILYYKSLTLLCMAAGGILSIFLLREIFPISGSRILSIFLISGILRGLVALYLVPKLVDFGITFNSNPVRSVTPEMTGINLLKFRPGLYYTREFWKSNEYQPKTQRKIRFSKEMKPIFLMPGLYSRPEKWVNYITGTTPVPAAVVAEASNPVVFQGLFYNPVAWDRYREATLQKNPAKENLKADYVLPDRRYSIPARPKTINHPAFV
jgi:hypothetical protein